MWLRPLSRRGQTQSKNRTRRGWQPSVIEALEGRALLAASALDPTFGTGGVVTGALSLNNQNPLAAVSALTAQGNGQIITAEVSTPTTDGGTTTTPLVVRRYNTNGTLDTTFGTSGQTVIPVAAGLVVQTAPRNLFVTGTGQILLTAEVSTAVVTNTTIPQDYVIRLNSNGQLDTNFGTNGEALLPSGITQVNSVLVTSTNRIVVAGIIPASQTGGSPTTTEAVLVGLTSTGALDTTFGTGGEVVFNLPTAQGSEFATYTITPVRETPTNNLLVGVSSSIRPTVVGGISAVVKDLALLEVTSTGGIATTFGGGTGKVDLGSTFQALDIAVVPNGNIILGGSGTRSNQTSGAGLLGLTSDGTVDSTFATPAIQPATASPIQALVRTVNGSYVALTTDATVYRFRPDGSIDSAFGRAGQIATYFGTSLPRSPGGFFAQNGGALGLTSTGSILVGGGLSGTTSTGSTSSRTLLAQIRPILLPQVTNNFDGSGSSNLAVELPEYGVFAYRTAQGNTVSQQFGPANAQPGQAILAVGDYDGDGRTDPALYLPAFGLLVYRPTGGGGDVSVRFGPTGAGQAIPAPGDYDGDGKTDVALFLPGSATFIVRPSSGGAPYPVQFGIAGAGNSIPVPGDYDGSGKTELAVYLPTLGALIYRPANGGADVAIPFGPAGVGASIPVPGDFDGDGKTDVALYLPGSSTFVVRPSGGSAPYPVTFGSAGAGNSIPVPGDYDGDGKTDIAVFLPSSAYYAIIPSGSGNPYPAQFGKPGAGSTVPATPVVMPQGTVSTMSLRSAASADPNAGVVVFLDDTTPRKKTTA